MSTIRNPNSLYKIAWRLARYLETKDFIESEDDIQENWPEITDFKYFTKAKEILRIK